MTVAPPSLPRRAQFLPFAPPAIGDGEINEVVDTLRSQGITTGSKSKRFERGVRDVPGRARRARPQLLQGQPPRGAGRAGNRPRRRGDHDSKDVRGDSPAVAPARRRPGDGLIPWDSGSGAVYDFVRALTKPYPGAFSWLDGKPWTVWSAALLPTNGAPPLGRPGEILGPVVSPLDAACGLAVACGRGVVQLLEVEADGGEVVAGRRLAEQPWTGRVWTGA